MSQFRRFILVFIILEAMHLKSSLGTEYRCSKRGDPCVFPFEYGGKVHNECVRGFAGYWCYTDLDFDNYEYCKICDDDTTSTTTTTTTTQSTTTARTTKPTTSSKITTTTTTKMTTPSTTVTTTTVKNSSRLKSSNKTISKSTTSYLVDEEQSTTPTLDNTQELEEEMTEVTSSLPRNLTMLDSSKPLKKVKETTETKTPSPPPNEDEEADKEYSETTKGATTTTQTIVRQCTVSGTDCRFPFTYKGKVYYSCVVSYFTTWGWCYTNEEKEYSDCLPCKESTTTTSTTTSTFESDDSRIVENGGITKTIKNPRKSVTWTDEPSAEKESTEPLDRAAQNDPGTGGSEPDEAKTKIVTTIVLVLSLLAVCVILVMVFLYVKKLRNKKNEERQVNGGESGKELLNHNKNGNHKPANDGNSQELQPLNSKPVEDRLAGGDCGITIEKAENDVTTSVNV